MAVKSDSAYTSDSCFTAATLHNNGTEYNDLVHVQSAVQYGFMLHVLVLFHLFYCE